MRGAGAPEPETLNPRPGIQDPESKKPKTKPAGGEPPAGFIRDLSFASMGLLGARAYDAFMQS